MGPSNVSKQVLLSIPLAHAAWWNIHLPDATGTTHESKPCRIINESVTQKCVLDSALNCQLDWVSNWANHLDLYVSNSSNLKASSAAHTNAKLIYWCIHAIIPKCRRSLSLWCLTATLWEESKWNRRQYQRISSMGLGCQRTDLASQTLPWYADALMTPMWAI